MRYRKCRATIILTVHIFQFVISSTTSGCLFCFNLNCLFLTLPCVCVCVCMCYERFHFPPHIFASLPIWLTRSTFLLLLFFVCSCEAFKGNTFISRAIDTSYFSLKPFGYLTSLFLLSNLSFFFLLSFLFICLSISPYHSFSLSLVVV